MGSVNRGESRACFFVCLVLINQAAHIHRLFVVVWMLVAAYYFREGWL